MGGPPSLPYTPNPLPFTPLSSPVHSTGELSDVAVEGEVFDGRVPALLHCLVPRLQRHAVDTLTVVTMTTPEKKKRTCSKRHLRKHSLECRPYNQSLLINDPNK